MTRSHPHPRAASARPAARSRASAHGASQQRRCSAAAHGPHPLLLTLTSHSLSPAECAMPMRGGLRRERCERSGGSGRGSGATAADQRRGVAGERASGGGCGCASGSASRASAPAAAAASVIPWAWLCCSCSPFPSLRGPRASTSARRPGRASVRALGRPPGTEHVRGTACPAGRHGEARRRHGMARPDGHLYIDVV